jgi:hypothetical protein
MAADVSDGQEGWAEWNALVGANSSRIVLMTSYDALQFAPVKHSL